MRHLVFGVLNIVFLLQCLACFSQRAVGTWQGKLNIGNNSLTLVFHIKQEEGYYKGTWDSPDQGANGLLIDKIEVNDSSVELQMREAQILFTGKIVSDSLMQGTFKQSFFSFPLELRKKAYTRNRPQTPVPPFPYSAEEVLLSIPERDMQLAGTLTLPQGKGNYPAVVLVTGSGPQNRNEEIFGHKPFEVIADYLTRQGYAVFRYDDRGVGQSTGDYASATMLDLVEDALSGWRYLKTRKEIDPRKIGILGHSEGGAIAFRAAAGNPEVAFVISLAGGALQGDSVLMMQNRQLLLDQNFGEAVTDNYCRGLRKVLDIKISTDKQTLKKDSLKLVQCLSDDKSIDLIPALKSNLFSVLFQDNPWLDFFLSYRPAEDIAKVRCPVLALNGKKDKQVDADANLNLIREVLEENGNRNCVVIKYENLNHLFQECITGQITEYNQIEQTVSPKVLNDIGNWLDQTVK